MPCATKKRTNFCRRAWSKTTKGKESIRKGRDKWNCSAHGRMLKFTWKLKVSYKITVEEFNAMWISQNFSCGVCKREDPCGRGWHVDHDHVTKKFRGILCMPCNLGIGYFHDTPEHLLSAVDYLRRQQ